MGWLLARQKGFEPPTFRLGGGCSIQLSYWRMFHSIVQNILLCVNCKSHDSFRFIFRGPKHILLGLQKMKGGTSMRQTNDPYADLDDLIFDEDAGGPSER